MNPRPKPHADEHACSCASGSRRVGCSRELATLPARLWVQAREACLRGGLRGVRDRDLGATGLTDLDSDLRGEAEGEARPLAREAERAGSEAGDLAAEEAVGEDLAASSLCNAGLGSGSFFAATGLTSWCWVGGVVQDNEEWLFEGAVGMSGVCHPLPLNPGCLARLAVLRVSVWDRNA